MHGKYHATSVVWFTTTHSQDVMYYAKRFIQCGVVCLDTHIPMQLEVTLFYPMSPQSTVGSSSAILSIYHCYSDIVRRHSSNFVLALEEQQNWFGLLVMYRRAG